MAPEGRRFDRVQLRITRGALILAALEIGLSLVWLMADKGGRASLETWLVATPNNVFAHARVWTLVTSPFLNPNFIGLIFHAIVLYSFVPVIERFWGTARFYRFAAITSIAGTLLGTLAGLATGRDAPIVGLDPFIYAAIVAFGIVYAKQPVKFWGTLPLTGRQLMYGFIGLSAVFVLAQGAWEQGAGFAAAMLAAAILCSKSTNPVLAYRRWKARRARAKLTVLQGGGGKGPFPPPKKKPDEKYLN